MNKEEKKLKKEKEKKEMNKEKEKSYVPINIILLIIVWSCGCDGELSPDKIYIATGYMYSLLDSLTESCQAVHNQI